ncbi:MAG: hypothetical protein IKZ97_02425 [Butyrivibrio sp.]|nr:hypothetical protein [Butyrivibrio sp.]
MIKKLLSIILSTMLMLSLAGFTQKEETKEPDRSESKAAPGFILNFDDSMSFDSDSKKTQFYLMDENGEKIKSLNAEMRKLLEENNIDPEGVQITFNDYVVGGLIFADIKVHEAEYEGFYAIDLENRKLQRVLPISEYKSIEYVDYYKDKFIVGVIDMRFDLAEYEFTLSDDFSFKKEKSKYDKVLKAINDNDMKVENQMPDFSLARMLGEVGYVVAYKNVSNEVNCMTIEDDGTEKKVDELDPMPARVIGYNKEKIYFDCPTEYYSEDTEINSLDLSSREITEELIEDDHISIKELYGDVLYYRKGSSFYKFEFGKEEPEELFHNVHRPGVNLYSGNYIVANRGNVYACDLSGDELIWFKITEEDGKPKVEDIKCPIIAFNYFKYGSVTTETYEVKCPYCGREVYENNYDLFKLDKKYSKYASRINSVLKKKIKKDKFLNFDPKVTSKLECDRHDDYDYENPVCSCEISDVSIIDSQFLTVKEDCLFTSMVGGYQPEEYTEHDFFIFDLFTGEELTIKDFFEGTEEEFKELVAGKSESYDEEYELASLEEAKVEFKEDHITYYFYPYEEAGKLSPVDIPYLEINGHLTLTRM